MPIDPSPGLQSSFIALVFGVLLIVSAAAKSRRLFVCGIAWCSLTGTLAFTGWFADFSAVPPRAGLLLGCTALLITLAALTSPGEQLAELPIEWLIGFQSFRIIVEVLIHQAVVEGVAPVQLCWDGYNFDIVTGVSALLMAACAKRSPKWVLFAWNSIGLAIVLSVVVVAVLSLPSPIQLLRPDNVWIAYFPFVWLPSILVFAAVLVHLVIYRKIAQTGLKG